MRHWMIGLLFSFFSIFYATCQWNDSLTVQAVSWLVKEEGWLHVFKLVSVLRILKPFASLGHVGGACPYPRSGGDQPVVTVKLLPRLS